MAATFALTLNSCTKEAEDTTPPKISFVTTGFVSKDTTLPMNTTIQTSILATKTGVNTPMTLFTITRTRNNVNSIVYSEELSGITGDIYNKVWPIITGDVVGTENYTYKVVNKNGVRDSVSLTLTVQ